MAKYSLSVIIPIYNTPKEYLNTCLNSLFAQTLDDIEILLVDDGSNQTCAKLCDDYCASDSRVRVIHQKNQGVSAARNRGIQEASAEWIMFVDADDWLELTACETIRFLLEQQDCDILMFNGVKNFANKTELLHRDVAESITYDTDDPQIREFLYRKAMRPQKEETFYYCWDKVYKRKFLVENAIMFPVGIPRSEDKVFILSCFEQLKKMRFVNESFYHYRMNAASVCHRYSENVCKDRIRLSELLFDIARRMDKEMAVLTSNPDYSQITSDCNRFVFGIISDVLFLQYYHPDNPKSARERNRAAKNFLQTEPFSSAIKNCRYQELSVEAKLKKFLLLAGLPSIFCAFRSLYRKLRGRVTVD